MWEDEVGRGRQTLQQRAGFSSNQIPVIDDEFTTRAGRRSGSAVHLTMGYQPDPRFRVAS